MTEAELREHYPELYAAVLKEGRRAGYPTGFAEGQAAGEAAERKRILGHLRLADESDSPEVARRAIESGASVLDMVTEYSLAPLKRRAIAERQRETDAVADIAGGAVAPDLEGSRDLGDQVVELLEQRRGKRPQA